MKTNTLLSFAVIGAVICACLCPSQLRAADVYESFTFDGRAYKQARLVEATPLDLAFMADGCRGLRIKREELPPELKAKYPYCPDRAAKYEKEKAVKARAQRDQDRIDIYNSLVRQEKEIQARLDAANEDMVALQREINVLRATPKGRGKVLARQLALERKLALTRQTEQLRRQAQAIRAMQQQYR